MYHSEFGQDKFLDETVFKGKRGGVFFECGALDGVMDSNSLFFERERGWTGLCIEANPDIINTLRKNRTCDVLHAAVMDKDDCMAAYIKINGGLFGWGGVKEAIEPQHMARILEKTSEDDRETVLVRSITLQKALTAFKMFKIDYATLDIEGAEYKVLKSFPFNRFDIEVFEIENNFDNYPIEELMINVGFKKINRLGVSDIYQKTRSTPS